MSTWHIYHNPRCSKSRQALQLLRDNNVEPKIIEYLKEVPDAATFGRLIDASDSTPGAFVRRKEKEFADYGETDLTDTLAVAAMLAACPKLLERPIVERDAKVIIARPPEKISELL